MPLSPFQVAAKLRHWRSLAPAAEGLYLSASQVRELLQDLDDMAGVDEAPTQRLPPIGETVRRRPPVPPAVRELKGPELLRALADELDRDGLSIEDLDPCGRGFVSPAGTAYCDRPAGHPGPHRIADGQEWEA